jgi:hypothetical protein
MRIVETSYYILKLVSLVEEKFFSFQELLPETVESLQYRGDLPPQLKDSPWLIELDFLTDLTAKPNYLNAELQGEKRPLLTRLTLVIASEEK